MSAYAGGQGAQGEAGAPGLKTRPVIWTFDPLVDNVTGDGQGFWFVPEDMDGWVLTAVAAGLDTPGTGATTVQIRNATQAVDMLSTPITIDTGEAHSKDATPPVINASNDEVAHGDKIVVDIDAIATNGRGLQVQAHFEYPLGGGDGGDVPWEDASPFFINGAAEFGGAYGPSLYAIHAGCLWLALTVNPGSDGQIADFGVAVRQTIVSGFGDGGPMSCEILADGTVDFFGNPTASAFLNAVIPLA